MHVGVRGYVESCREIVGAAKKLEQLIRAEVPELKIMGKPLVSVVAFEAREGRGVSIYSVGDAMSKKGWHRASSGRHTSSQAWLADLARRVQSTRCRTQQRFTSPARGRRLNRESSKTW